MDSIVRDVSNETNTVRFSVFDDIFSGLDHELRLSKEAFIRDMIKILKNTSHFEGIVQNKFEALQQEVKTLSAIDKYIKEKGVKINELIKKANTLTNRISLPFEALSDNKLLLHEARVSTNIASEKIKKVHLQVASQLNSRQIFFKNVQKAESFQEICHLEESLKYEKNKLSILEQISNKERKIFNMVQFRNATVTVSREV